ncbi:MAG: hypothetical protein JO128_03245 [Alphaproteobacteria bacterium]|nr:hypothetical protein [Alphaproteobacteria bacterium]
MGDPRHRQVVIVVGDSHSSAYNGLTYTQPETGREFLAIAANAGGDAVASALVSADGASFHPTLVGELDRTRSLATEISEQPPLYVLSLGGPDAVLETADETWRHYDFILPAMPGITDRTKRCLQYALVKASLERRLAPFERALDCFRAAGVGISAVLPPPPAYRSNRKVMALLMVYGKADLFVAPFPVRGKIGWMTRCYFAALAERRAIPFVDTWPILADGLFLRPDYESDGIHVSVPAAATVFPLLCAALTQRLPLAGASPTAAA